MVRTLLFIILSFVVQLNAFADVPLQQCTQPYNQQDSQASFETCLPLAAQGSGEASFILSNLYTQGIGDNQPDLQNALVWLVESAKQGHGPACFNLAALYERGKVVDQDYALAYSWYERGAERGHTDSQFKVGIMSLKGIGTEANPKKAHSWLGKAAESGNQNAQVTLAILLSDSDAQKSLNWYNRAADQGNPYAYYQLADVYANGMLGQPVDLKKALYLAQKSVILGRAASQELVDRIRQKIKSSATLDSPAIATPEVPIVDTVTDANSEVASTETITTEATLPTMEMSRESQSLAAVMAQPQLSTEQSTASKVEVTTGLSAMHKDKAWLMAQPPGHYVLQLVQLSSEASVMRYLKQMGLVGKANYYHAHTNAGRVYVVLYSESYPGFQAAKNAVRQTFSAELQKSVWHRRYQDLQTSYRAP